MQSWELVLLHPGRRDFGAELHRRARRAAGAALPRHRGLCLGADLPGQHPLQGLASAHRSPWGLLAVIWVVAGKIYPAIVQQYRVSPNEIAAERPYIANNIEATRWAFGLDQVTQRRLPGRHGPHRRGHPGRTGTIDNIRLWDPRPLLDTYRQIQELRLYYDFTDVDVDRYTIDGEYRQVMLAGPRARPEQAAGPGADLGQPAPHLHPRLRRGGEPGERATAEGLPDFFVQDIPPRHRYRPARITRPGDLLRRAGQRLRPGQDHGQEFDYPKGTDNVYTTYEGKGGVPIGSPRPAGWPSPSASARSSCCCLRLPAAGLAHHVPPHARASG